MKIYVVSDSHKNLSYLDKTIQLCLKDKTDLFIHLGDDYSDITDIEGIRVVKVPGVFDPEYKDRAIAHRQVLDLDGIKALLTHVPRPHQDDAPSDLDPMKQAKKERVDIVLFGHTHLPSIEEKEGILWANPGHLRLEDKKGFPASYSIIEIKPRSLLVKIIELLTGKVMFSKEKAR